LRRRHRSCPGAWHDVPLEYVAFCADGQRVFTRANQKARLWPVDCLASARARLPRSLTTVERQRFELTPAE
jgi:hypothetical protein